VPVRHVSIAHTVQNIFMYQMYTNPRPGRWMM
jgi:hypothetical protein